MVVESTSDLEHLRKLRDWTSAMETLWTAILTEGEGFRVEDNMHPGFGGMGGSFGSSFQDGSFGNGLSMKHATRKQPPVKGGRGGKMSIAGF